MRAPLASSRPSCVAYGLPPHACPPPLPSAIMCAPLPSPQPSCVPRAPLPSPQERQALVDEFNRNPSIFVFLISTPTGGQGLVRGWGWVVCVGGGGGGPWGSKDMCVCMGGWVGGCGWGGVGWGGGPRGSRTGVCMCAGGGGSLGSKQWCVGGEGRGEGGGRGGSAKCVSWL